MFSSPDKKQINNKLGRVVMRQFNRLAVTCEIKLRQIKLPVSMKNTGAHFREIINQEK